TTSNPKARNREESTCSLLPKQRILGKNSDWFGLVSFLFMDQSGVPKEKKKRKEIDVDPNYSPP
ncbi:hypothetical protein ACQP3C_30815, partial [Escherichia coli]